MVKKVKINPEGKRVSFSISFEGLIVASYEYLLWEAQSNEVLVEKKGNNQNPFDDTYKLPMPVNSNIGRVIDIRARFVGIDPQNVEKYKVKVDFYQDGKITEIVEEGDIDGKSQFSQIYIIIEN